MESSAADTDELPRFDGAEACKTAGYVRHQVVDSIGCGSNDHHGYGHTGEFLLVFKTLVDGQENLEAALLCE